VKRGPRPIPETLLRPIQIELGQVQTDALSRFVHTAMVLQLPPIEADILAAN